MKYPSIFLTLFVALVSLIGCSNTEEKVIDLLNEGDALWEDGQAEQALQLFDQAIQLDPDSAHGYTGRGMSYRSLDQLDKALADLNQAIELDSNYEVAFRERGMVYYNKGSYDLAINDCNQAVELNPSYARGYLCLGYIYEDLEEYQDALTFYSKTIDLDNQEEYAFAYRGELLRYQFGDYNQAIDDLKRAVELDPAWAFAHASLGAAYSDSGNYSQAIDSLSTAVELDTNDFWAYYTRAWPYFIENQYENSIADLNKVLSLTTDSYYVSNAHFRLGRNYYALGDYQDAIDSFTSSISTSSEEPVYSYYNRAISYDEIGDTQDAFEDYIKFLELEPMDNELTYYACDRANFIAFWDADSLGELLINIFTSAPCDRYDVAFEQEFYSDEFADYGEDDTDYYAPEFMPTGRYFNPQTGSYQNTPCSECTEEIAPVSP